ncbi:MAG: peptidylprolyl isomerase, partial [Solobacterium sp.]|nr:peptidylprolyl isomerase [Solobacterium sp.]
MGNFIKKNIFLCIIIALLAGISIFYIYDTNTGKLPGKRSGTEDVVYEINGEDITAEQFYEQMYKNGGEQIVAELFGRTVVDQSIETTADLEAWAQNQAAAVEQNYKYSYGASYKDVIGQAL